MFSFSTFRKISLLSLLLVLSIQVAFAQERSKTIKGRVSDARNGLPMEGVSVQLGSKKKTAITDKAGAFLIPADSSIPGQKLTFSHIGYEVFTIIIGPNQREFMVTLLPKTTDLSEVKVSASKKTTTSKVLQETVLDFAIAVDKLYILSQAEKQKTPTLKVLDLYTDQVLLSSRLPVYSKKLYVDCLDNLHLVNDDFVYQVYSDTLGLSLYPPYNKADFDQIIDPCQAADNERAYFRRKRNKGIIQSFYAVNLHTRQGKLLQTIADKEILIMQADEARFQRNRYNMNTEGLINPHSMNRILAGAARSAEFGQHFMIRGPYVPLLKVGKDICIFDHVNGNIEFYRNDSLSSVTPIKYHHQKNWAKQNLVDPVKEKAYVVFTRNGLPELKLLNLETGELENSYKIANPFASKITLHSGQVYFLYKDMADNNRQHLYKAALNTLQN